MATCKQMVQLASALVVVVAAACGGHVAIQRPIGEPTRLVNQLESLASPNDVKQRPEFAGTHWVVVEDSKTRKASKSAQFDDYVIVADSYTVGSVAGSLRVEFLNGMLLATWFYPTDYQKCVDELAAAGVVFPTGSEASGSVAVSAGDTNIRLGKDHEGRRYVAWEDRRLVDQMNRWLLRNS